MSAAKAKQIVWHGVGHTSLRLLALTALALPAFNCASAVAPAEESPRAQRPARHPAPSLTADQAAQRAWEQTGGHVISIRQQPDGYWVRMLSARGQVREIWIPSTNR
ncbi:hypothetical protein [Thiorhodovibrio frisius]|uniref:Peptidase propeptide domain-containing protein n=1 Tax=Thiorhodovibrio frisius TaxID=631362 RepID=H8Z4X2_9GAMM|nr:hypothetical protein [Thiorhodovibrio frisius]EIC20379.1 hypothetical protein Thi970DRAFT_04012 [Thiorhodovibrio frisius]WPL21121.1 hypothetical protein Thiofri_01229 [Thiorhodovibrio frisius]